MIQATLSFGDITGLKELIGLSTRWGDSGHPQFLLGGLYWKTCFLKAPWGTCWCICDELMWYYLHVMNSAIDSVYVVTIVSVWIEEEIGQSTNRCCWINIDNRWQYAMCGNLHIFIRASCYLWWCPGSAMFTHHASNVSNICSLITTNTDITI